MHELIRLPTALHRNISSYQVGDKKRGVISESKKEKQGHITTRTFRVVCETCNNTWMSGIEEEAKPILMTLISGSPGHLDVATQNILATWICLKVMVVEQNRPEEAVFSQEERKVFMECRTIPSCIRMWIARCFSSLWRNAFMRCSGQLAVSTVLPPKVFPSRERKNMQTSTLGIGELFVYAMVSKAEGVELNDLIKVSDYLIPIFPTSGKTIELPIRYIVADESVRSFVCEAYHVV